MELISVDQSLCIRCGRCVAVCPRGLIHLDGQWPQSQVEDLCIGCGQCVAVCPVAALDNRRAPLAGQTAAAKQTFTAEAAYQFLRSRRSVRCFKQAPVERAKLLQLLDLARLAPSGGNSQGIAYQVIENRAVLAQITAETVSWMEQQVEQGIAAAKVYAQYAAMYRKMGRDSILRSAPCLVLATADASFVRARENSHFTLAYAELYAPSLGLGTCWAGLMESAAYGGHAPLLKLIDIPAGRQLCGAVMVGYPEFKFPRWPDRKPLDVRFVED
jgi:nitroreductase/NAD-dependent dihydropyrimidine dehydrogenase PreA subunit